MGLKEEILRIVLMSLFVSITSTFVASAVGMTIAIPIALAKFKYKKIIVIILQNFMSIPPVLMGLSVYLLLSKSGPLGEYGILFTPLAMVIAQTLLILPIIIGLIIPIIETKGNIVKKNILALGGNWKTITYYIFLECRNELLSIGVAGFGRGISEVGAVMMVGGNIKGYTRVMTTYIALETGKGNFDGALLVGVILLIISFLINFILKVIIKEDK